MHSPQSHRQHTIRLLALLLLLSLASTYASYLLGPRSFGHGDTATYLRMATGSPNHVPAPWAYRILIPWIVHILPLSPQAGFGLVTIGATLGTLISAYYIFRTLFIPNVPALITMALLSFSYPVALGLGHMGMIDPGAGFLQSLALLAIVRRRFLFAAIAVSVALLAKETALLLMPLLILQLLRSPSLSFKRRVIHGTIIVLIPLTVLAALRAAVNPRPGPWDIHNVNDIVSRLEYIWDYNTSMHGPALRFAREFLRSYGFFWVAALLGFRRQTHFRLETMYLTLLGIALCVVATDWSRMLGFGVMGIFTAVAFFVGSFHRVAGRPAFALGGLILLAAVQSWLSRIFPTQLEPNIRLAWGIGTAATFVTGAILCVAMEIQMRRRLIPVIGFSMRRGEGDRIASVDAAVGSFSTRIRRRVRAPRAKVFRALVDPRAVAAWMVPPGMTSHVHAFDAREGGSIRITLAYDEPTTRGKTTARTDTYHGRFVRLVPDEEVVQVLEFETDDPAMRGEMTVSFTLTEVEGGTDVLAVHDTLPPGLSPAENEAGWRMALDKLAAFVESAE